MPGLQGIPILGAWNTVGSTFSGSTAITVGVPPYPGPTGGAPYMYNALATYVPLLNSAPVPTKANWLAAPNFGVTRITSLQVQTSGTAHTLYVFRPFNWTYFPAGLPKNTTVIPDTSGAGGTGIFDDPGIYSTNYKYPTAGGTFPAQVADAAISSTNLNVCYQLTDGSWLFDTIASGTFGATLTLTTGTPNRTGGAIPAGGVMFYFGSIAGSLKDPASGQAAIQFNLKVSAQQALQDYLVAECNALHQGDPLLIYNANGTAADSVYAAGCYTAW